MKLSYFVKSQALLTDRRVLCLLEDLSESFPDVSPVSADNPLSADSDMLLSLGGDGTFLSAAAIAAPLGIPVMGVNFGRMGFLSEFRPSDVRDVLETEAYSIEDRTMLKIAPEIPGVSPSYALNDASFSRAGASMLGVDVETEEGSLPTYWADGLLVSTSSGSTAYSLSVGGPICLPASRVMIISPISPHNLNVRPIVVPDSAGLRISFKSREQFVRLTIDGEDALVPSKCSVKVSPAEFVLRKVVSSDTNFIDALKSRLLWGEDVRNKQ